MNGDASDLYQDIILRHARAPRHQEKLDPFDAESQGDNPLCGDRCTVRVRFGAERALDRVAFEGRGCTISLASADMMADALAGASESEARRLAGAVEALVRGGGGDPALGELRALAGVAEYPSRIKCALLPWAALLAALDGRKEASSERR